MSENEHGTNRGARISRRTDSQLEALLNQGLAPGLHIVATPIGNLGDISLRALAALASADRLLCEDTRRARKLLSHYGISRDLRVYEEHSAERIRPYVLEWLRAGEAVALISDAGTPLISDPGYKLVRDAVEAGVPVHTVPGPVAAVAALTVSGLPTDSFFFAGFLPPRAAARRQRLSELAGVEATLIFYESAARLMSVLRDIADTLGERKVTIVREITKRFETHYRGTAEALLAELEGPALKGEIVVLVEPPTTQGEVSDELILQQLEQATRTMSPRDAVRWVADVLNVQRKRVYDLMVAQRRDQDH
ncbi:16S rRNA (cytidine(1402)-2'-O)-methyltransferase [Dichotomicrobium thermohalophilum]|uniref:Ribosomal RNA small subunit methyltransferase I n=1 Tax=Dichotomicrobium thermohalophilum TaxID=933063 RepID=A0A397PHP1_9HYPH|nr:16S rRNA (cytidine(1402)-2'-O)-methyltransferase [Dichotomicrobium thermohalophilum]RIA47399.1 16S rRNA (cytidine1402-2'-O)-methyltransferase [Dichotomicrobium thermohalophilum]